MQKKRCSDILRIVQKFCADLYGFKETNCTVLVSVLGKLASRMHQQQTWGAELLTHTSKLFTQPPLFMYLYRDWQPETNAVYQLCCIWWILFLAMKSLQSQVNKRLPKHTLKTFKLCWEMIVGWTSQAQTVWTLHYHHCHYNFTAVFIMRPLYLFISPLKSRNRDGKGKHQEIQCPSYDNLLWWSVTVKRWKTCGSFHITELVIRQKYPLEKYPKHFREPCVGWDGAVQHIKGWGKLCPLPCRKTKKQVMRSSREDSITNRQKSLLAIMKWKLFVKQGERSHAGIHWELLT